MTPPPEEIAALVARLRLKADTALEFGFEDEQVEADEEADALENMGSALAEAKDNPADFVLDHCAWAEMHLGDERYKIFGPMENLKLILQTFRAAEERAAKAEREREMLRAEIQNIFDKAKTHETMTEAGEEWIKSYVLPCGPIHRAIGKAGHIVFDLREIGFTLETDQKTLDELENMRRSVRHAQRKTTETQK